MNRISRTASRAALATAALCAGTYAPTVFAQDPLAAGVDAAPVPVLQWALCEPEPFECATARVPLDYADPHGRTIDLALKRLPAGNAEGRIGSLFVNPGGPGVSGANYVEAAEHIFSQAVLDRFDIVGFDPRFVGGSGSLPCAPRDEYHDIFNGTLPELPVTAAEERQLMDVYARYAAACAKHAPDLQYASTANVARDLELLRRAVGDAEINYAGYSYGSVLGQTYAALYPNQIRALLIDGVADAQAWSGTPEQASVPLWVRIGTARGISESVAEFFRKCAEVGPELCRFSQFGDPATSFARLADELRARPSVPENPQFNYAALIQIVVSSINGQYKPGIKVWRDLGEYLASAYEHAFGIQKARESQEATARQLLDRAASLRAQTMENTWLQDSLGSTAKPEEQYDGKASSNAIRCADVLAPRSLEEWSRAAAAEEERWPHFGKVYTFEPIACASWQLPAPGRYSGPYDRPTSAPILVASTRFDMLTPLHNAEAVANRIPGARLVVQNGVGHTTPDIPSKCMIDIVSDYFVAGTLPPNGHVCEDETVYFHPPETEWEPEEDEPLP